jgi:hypothetical protein
MSGGVFCHCDEQRVPIEDRRWTIWQYRCNHSAFNGYHYTRSDYSSINCTECGHVWRTKAAYVFDLEVRGYYE